MKDAYLNSYNLKNPLFIRKFVKKIIILIEKQEELIEIKGEKR